MCFSATASFVTAGAGCIIGGVALIRAGETRALTLAAVPVLFGVQQAVEGLLWLELPRAPQGAASTGLTLLFLLFAEVLWPIYAPMAAMLNEPDERRRRWLAACLAAGAPVAGYMLWSIFAGPHDARIVDGHIVYGSVDRSADLALLVYLAAVGLPLVLSSQRTLVVLGAIVMVGATVAYWFYREAFVSVWCFFAAAASLVILFHFERIHRRRLRLARA